MANRNRTKKTNNIVDITIHKKLKTEQHRTTVKSEKIFTTMLHVNRRGSEMENRNRLHCDKSFFLSTGPQGQSLSICQKMKQI